MRGHDLNLAVIVHVSDNDSRPCPPDVVNAARILAAVVS